MRKREFKSDSERERKKRVRQKLRVREKVREIKNMSNTHRVR